MKFQDFSQDFQQFIDLCMLLKGVIGTSVLTCFLTIVQ